jgi:hypothetical protein
MRRTFASSAALAATAGAVTLQNQETNLLKLSSKTSAAMKMLNNPDKKKQNRYSIQFN